MTWQADAFRSYFVTQVGKETSANSYAVNLRKLDAYTGGLDQKIEELGYEPIIAWAKSQHEGPFDGPYASSVRSALIRYVKFLIDASDPEAAAEDTAEADHVINQAEEPDPTIFQYERELQLAVRRQIATLFPGLSVADGGREKSVSTGRIDIFTTDENGDHVAIELKAGSCPPGAIEQVLGYAENVEVETARSCRAILVAADFSDRIRLAARRIPTLSLKTYRLQVAIEDLV